MMTATDELRRLLDERGVEHYDGTESTLWLKDEHGYRASADEVDNGMMQLHVWCTTPAQAVEATLGRGECRIDLVSYTQTKDTYQCRSCDKSWTVPRGRLLGYNFCPSCGRKVVGDD